MKRRPDQLALRREALLLKIRAQRQLLTLQLQDVKQSTEVAELGYQCASNAVGALRRRPLLAVAIGAGLLLVKPSKIVSLSRTALNTWQIWKVIAPLIKEWKSRANLGE